MQLFSFRWLLWLSFLGLYRLGNKKHHVWQAFRFFSATQNAIGFDLKPAHLRTPSKGNLVYRIYIHARAVQTLAQIKQTDLKSCC